MQLYVEPCHVVSAKIAVPIENPADCEARGVICFQQADEVLGYLTEEASSRVELFCCTSAYRPALLREQFHRDIFEHSPYSPDLAPWDIPKMKEHLARKRFARDEDLKDDG